MTNGFNKLCDFLKFGISGLSTDSFPPEQSFRDESIYGLSHENGEDTNEAWPPNQPPNQYHGEHQAERFCDEGLSFPKSRHTNISTEIDPI